MFYCYILYNSSINKYYIGQTSNLDERLKYHNQGHSKKYTSKQAGVWELVYWKNYNSRSAAILREKYLKSLKSKLSLQKLVEQPR